MKIYECSFTNSVGPENILDFVVMANNKDSVEYPRLTIENCKFSDSDVSEMILFDRSNTIRHI